MDGELDVGGGLGEWRVPVSMKNTPEYQANETSYSKKENFAMNEECIHTIALKE
jgi:hypothetical protein